MKTKLLAIVTALMACSLFADYQYLYWSVNVQPEYEFLYATVKKDGTVLLSNNTKGGVDAGEYIGNNSTSESGLGTQTESVYAYDVTGYAGSTFLFELFDAYDNRVAFSWVSGSALTSYIGDTMSQLSNPYVLTNVVPEPTSGMLLLLGVAGLALRRRKIA